MYLAVILPIIMLGIYLYYWSYNNASEEISRNAHIQLNSYLSNLEREIEWMEIQQFDIVQDSELRRTALTWDIMDNVDKKSSMDYLVQRLTSIKNTSPYIKDIYIHIASINKTISAGNAVHDFEQEKFDFIHSGIQGNERRLIKKEDSLFICTSVLGNTSVDEPLIVVNIDLDTVFLKGTLESLNTYPNSGSFLISEEMGLIIATGEESKHIIKDYKNASHSSSDIMKVITIQNENYHIDNEYSDSLGLSVVTYLPVEVVRRPLTKFSYWAIVFAATSIIGLFIYAFLTYRLVHRPLLLLVQGFKRMEKGRLDQPIEHSKNDEFGFLYDRYNKMMRRLRMLIEQDYKQKMMMQKAELKQLQSQINPHFLYNSFFILNSLAKIEDTERIELFTNMLGDYFRFITKNGESEVSLIQEVNHARTYTEIQNLRFSRRISVQFDELPKEMEQIKVPRLIIQPLIENAFEHSLEKKVEEGFLHVSFEMKEETEALIIVEDNGEFISDGKINQLSQSLHNVDETQEMSGMINIHRRIVLTYGSGSGLFLSRSHMKGLRVEVRIILKKENLNV